MSYTEVVKREFKRICTRPLSWIVSFVVPVFMCILICLIFGKGSPVDLPIAVYNADNSELSRLFVRNLKSLPSCNVKYRVNSLKEGQDLLTEGKIYGFVVIPKDFQKDIYKLKQPTLMYYYNNQRILIGGIITKDISAMLQSMVVGIDAKIRNKKGLPIDIAISQANPIAVIDNINANPYFNYLYFLALIAFGHTLQINMVMMSVYSIGTEFKDGTTKDWLEKANNSIVIGVLGKWTPYFIMFLAVFFLLYIVYFVGYGVPFYGNILAAIIATLCFMFACFFVGVLFISINGNLRYCLSSTAFYVAMGFAFAGVTFPTMSMPLLARIYGFLMPVSYWIRIMINQTFRKIPILYDIKYFVGLVILTIIGAITLIRLKKLAFDEKRWYLS